MIQSLPTIFISFFIAVVGTYCLSRFVVTDCLKKLPIPGQIFPKVDTALTIAIFACLFGAAHYFLAPNGKPSEAKPALLVAELEPIERIHTDTRMKLTTIQGNLAVIDNLLKPPAGYSRQLENSIGSTGTDLYVALSSLRESSTLIERNRPSFERLTGSRDVEISRRWQRVKEQQVRLEKDADELRIKCSRLESDVQRLAQIEEQKRRNQAEKDQIEEEARRRAQIEKQEKEAQRRRDEDERQVRIREDQRRRDEAGRQAQVEPPRRGDEAESKSARRWWRITDLRRLPVPGYNTADDICNIAGQRAATELKYVVYRNSVTSEEVRAFPTQPQRNAATVNVKVEVWKGNGFVREISTVFPIGTVNPRSALNPRRR